MVARPGGWKKRPIPALWLTRRRKNGGSKRSAARGPPELNPATGRGKPGNRLRKKKKNMGKRKQAKDIQYNQNTAAKQIKLKGTSRGAVHSDKNQKNKNLKMRGGDNCEWPDQDKEGKSGRAQKKKKKARKKKIRREDTEEKKRLRLGIPSVLGKISIT